MVRRIIKNLGICILLVLISSLISCGEKPESPQARLWDLEKVMDEFQKGNTETVIAQLKAIVKANPDGKEGDKAALILGNILVSLRRNSEALPYLDRAIKGTLGVQYASVLLVRAVVGGEISSRYDAADGLAAMLASGKMETVGEVSPLLREEGRYFQVKLGSLQRNWQKAADSAGAFISEWPGSNRIDEVRWLRAESLRNLNKISEAHAEYEYIWYETPGSPWVKQAHKQAIQIEQSGLASTRRLSAEQQYDFIQALRKVGLHQEALNEIDRFLSEHPNHSKVDGALFLQAQSLQSLRKNDACLSAIERLRREYPRSNWVPGAVLVAIKVYRSRDDTSEVRRWCRWVAEKYPGHPKELEALFNLGTYLSRQDDVREGISTLWQVVEKGGQAVIAEDALWKIAWAYRNLGDTAQAIDALRQLIDQHPKTGYRAAALYWIGRFDETDRSSASQSYLTLVREYPNDYYGHQAEENLLAMGIRPDQRGSGIKFPPVDLLKRADARPGQAAYSRAVMLKSLGLYEFAAAELLTLPGVDADPSVQFALAELYSRSGNTMAAIRILGQHFKPFLTSGSRDPALVPTEFWHIYYPYNYRDLIRQAIQEAGLANAGINPYLVASLIRMESLFQATAVSPAGAIGLMQLMPDTASQIARERGLAPPSHTDLFQPDTNIRYGTYYLSQRVREFDGDWFPAICSYNCGPEPVRRWLAAKPPGQPTDEFIENIPYLDTRLYIKRILGDYKNYEWIYRQD